MATGTAHLFQAEGRAHAIGKAELGEPLVGPENIYEIREILHCETSIDLAIEHGLDHLEAHVLVMPALNLVPESLVRIARESQLLEERASLVTPGDSRPAQGHPLPCKRTKSR